MNCSTCFYLNIYLFTNIYRVYVDFLYVFVYIFDKFNVSESDFPHLVIKIFEYRFWLCIYSKYTFAWT